MKKLAALVATSTLVLAGSALAATPVIPTQLIGANGPCAAAVSAYVGKGIELRTRAEYHATGNVCWDTAASRSVQQIVNMDYFSDNAGTPPAQ